MAILDTNGLTIRRQPDILTELRDSYLSRISSEIVFDSNTFFGEDTVIISEQIASLEQGIQAVYNSFDVTKAEGVSLDRLVELVGVYRLGAEYTTGTQTFVGKNGTVIQVGTLIENPSTGDRFTIDVNSILDVSSCRYGIYKVSNVLNETQYQITINASTFTYTSDVDATSAEIAAGLVFLMNQPSTRKWLGTVVNGDQIKIETIVDDNISISAITYLEPLTTAIHTSVTAIESGPVRAPSNSVTKIITPVVNITSSYNELEYITGRFRETDTELRLRTKLSLSLSGSSTVEALYSAINNLAGITSVEIFENDTMFTDIAGRPAKSFECVVVGGLDLDVATAIWQDKPAGIQSYGNTTVVITDSRGKPHGITFSRPTAVNIAVEVTATTYSEETLPASADELIKNAVVTYGGTFTNGEDVIAKRFFGPIYSAVSGLDDVVVRTQTLTNQGDAPIPGNWSTSNLSILSSEIASFATIDVYVSIS